MGGGRERPRRLCPGPFLRDLCGAVVGWPLGCGSGTACGGCGPSGVFVRRPSLRAQGDPSDGRRRPQTAINHHWAHILLLMHSGCVGQLLCLTRGGSLGEKKGTARSVKQAEVFFAAGEALSGGGLLCGPPVCACALSVTVERVPGGSRPGHPLGLLPLPTIEDNRRRLLETPPPQQAVLKRCPSHTNLCCRCCLCCYDWGALSAGRPHCGSSACDPTAAV